MFTVLPIQTAENVPVCAKYKLREESAVAKLERMREWQLINKNATPLLGRFLKVEVYKTKQKGL